jgi:LPXTG-motif cell wall-anchored protein
MAPTPTATPTPPVTLPETGFDAWSIAAVGMALILVVFGARRLRRS